jgi:hypothetical protein
MRILYKIVLTACFLTTATTAVAGPQVLGFEVGVSTVTQVKQALLSKGSVADNGMNKWSGGPMFTTDGSLYNIEGISNVLYIFDNQQKLAGVILTMGKNHFDPVFDVLAKKYPVVSQERPFVGNHYARFKAPDAIVEVVAPHMSFDMEVRYLRNDLLNRFTSQSNAEANAKKHTEEAAF